MTVPDIDLQLAHQAAARNHKTNQKIAGFRHAARVLEANLPSGELQRLAVKGIAATLRADAVKMEVAL